MLNVSTFAMALAPTFAVGFGIQHFNEVLDPVFSKLAGKDGNQKKLYMGLSSLVFAALATHLLDLHLIRLLSDSTQSGDAFMFLDRVVTSLVVSTGTEGINSIIKFLGYIKEEKKATAAQGEAAAGAAIGKVNREP
jgi:hypothetical protein